MNKHFIWILQSDLRFAGDTVAVSEGQTSNSEPDLTAIFETLSDWEHQLKALEKDIPLDFEEPSP